MSEHKSAARMQELLVQREQMAMREHKYDPFRVSVTTTQDITGEWNTHVSVEHDPKADVQGTLIPDGYVPSNAEVAAFLGYCHRPAANIAYLIHPDDVPRALAAALAKIAEGAGEENGMNYCPRCGGRIVFVPPPPDEEEASDA